MQRAWSSYIQYKGICKTLYHYYVFQQSFVILAIYEYYIKHQNTCSLFVNMQRLKEDPFQVSTTHLIFHFHVNHLKSKLPSWLKGTLDKSSSALSPQLFPKKVEIFIPLEMLAWVMIACWVSHYRLTYFWRNMIISSIFYFSKSTSINTQYSSLWDTLKMMLFTKYLIKWKCMGRISWKFWFWFNLKSSIELDMKNRCYTCPIPLQNWAENIVINGTFNLTIHTHYIFLFHFPPIYVLMFLKAAHNITFKSSVELPHICNKNKSASLRGDNCMLLAHRP